jgi:hypothetical protein
MPLKEKEGSKGKVQHGDRKGETHAETSTAVEVSYRSMRMQKRESGVRRANTEYENGDFVSLKRLYS